MASQFLREKKSKKYWLTVISCLALVVLLGTYAALKFTGQAKNVQIRQLDCTLEVHQHTDECYDDEGNVTCGQADFVVHTHNDDCYSDGTLICELPEIKAHQHTDECYGHKEVLVCAEAVTAAHAHNEDCYTPVETLTCEQEEVQAEAQEENQEEQAEQVEAVGHTHTEDCYTIENVLTCEQEETTGHDHTDDCYEIENYLTCEKPEITLHTHKASCYIEVPATVIDPETGAEVEGTEKVLTCDQLEVLEHTHNSDCIKVIVVATNEQLNIKPIAGTNSIVSYGANSNSSDGAFDLEDAKKLKVTLKKKVGNRWVTVDEFAPGDEVQINLDFTISGGTLQKGGQFTYQIPGVVEFAEEFSFKIYDDNDNYVGDAVVTTDGLITVTLKSDFDVSADMKGNLTVKGKIRSDATSDEQDVTFPGTGTTIVIEKNTSDPDPKDPDPSDPDPDKPTPKPSSSLGVDKSITETKDNGDGTKTVTYKVKVYTNTFTEGDITLDDYYSNLNPQPSAENIVVRKCSYSNPNGTELNPQPTVRTGKNGGFQMTLPKLTDNQSWYEIIYKVTIDANEYSSGSGYLAATNIAEANDGKNTGRGSKSVVIREAQIEKSGEYRDGKFYWTIKVAAGNRGKTVTDIPGTNLKELLKNTEYLPGGADSIDVTVTVDGKVKETIKLSQLLKSEDGGKGGYTLTEDGEYIFSFSTPSGLAVGENKSYSNGAGVGGSTDNSGNIPGTRQGWGVNKGTKGVSDVPSDDGILRAQVFGWVADITFPDDDSWNKVIFKDEFPQWITDVDRSEAHVAVKNTRTLSDLRKELKQSLDIFQSSHADAGLVFTLSFTDVNGTIHTETMNGAYQDGCTLGSHNNLEIKAFSITIENPNKVSLSGQKLNLVYSSVIEFPDGIQPNRNYKAYNYCWLTDEEGKTIEDSAVNQFQYHEKVNNTLEKRGCAPGGEYSVEDTILIYDSSENKELKVNYKILYRFQSDDANKELTITDLIPDGLILDTNSIEMKYMWIKAGDDGSNPRTEPFMDTVNGQVRLDYSRSYNNNTLVLKIPAECVSSEVLAGKGDWSGYGIMLTYTCKVDPAKIDDIAKSGEPLTNVVTVNGLEADHDVYIENSYVAKFASYDEELNKATYKLTINPDRADLIPGSDVVTLSDTITMKGDGVDFEGGLIPDIDSVKVWRVEPDGTRVLLDPAHQYKFKFSDKGNGDSKYLLEMELPDSTYLEVEYSYYVNTDEFAGDKITLSNTASLAGHTSSKSSGTDHYQEGSGSLSQEKFTLTKYGDDNQGNRLSDAEFTIYALQSNGEWGEYVKATTNSEGKIIFTMGSQPTDSTGIADVYLAYDVVYAIVETDAPDGYVVGDSSVRYICKLDEDTDIDKFWSKYNNRIQAYESTKIFTPDNNDINFSLTSLLINNPSDGTKPYPVYKVESGNMSKHLSGATFNLYVWENNEWNDLGEVVTDKDGAIWFTKEKDYAGGASQILLKEGTVYALIETGAPAGYQIDSTAQFYYYGELDAEIWQNQNHAIFTTKVDAEQTLGSSANMQEIGRDSAFYISNDPAPEDRDGDVTAKKEWLNTDGSQMSASAVPEAVNVTLKQYANGANYKESQTADYPCEFKVIWNGVEKSIWVASGATVSVDLLVERSATVHLNYNGLVEEQTITTGGDHFFSFDVGTAGGTLELSGTGFTFNNKFSVLSESHNYPDYYDNNTLRQTLNAENNWQYEWSGLPVAKDGVVYTYEVVEDIVEGYLSQYDTSITTDEQGNTHYVITVKNQKKTEIPEPEPGKLVIRKDWQNADGTEKTANLPNSVTVRLRRSYLPVQWVKTYPEEVGGKDKITGDDSELCNFTLKTVGGNESTVKFQYDSNISWQNKVYEGRSLTVKVPRNSKIVVHMEYWSSTFTVSPKDANGKSGVTNGTGPDDYVFYIGDVPNYTVTISGSNFNAPIATLYTSHTAANAQPVVDSTWSKTVELTAPNYEISLELDKANSEGAAYTYEIEEILIDGVPVEDTDYEMISIKFFNSDKEQIDGPVVGGSVVITNQSTTIDGYELPETGGKGMMPFAAAGTVVLFGGAAYATIRRRRRYQ